MTFRGWQHMWLCVCRSFLFWRRWKSTQVCRRAWSRALRHCPTSFRIFSCRSRKNSTTCSITGNQSLTATMTSIRNTYSI